MSALLTAIEVEGWLFLAAVALIVFYRFVSGAIDIGRAQLTQMQLLAATIGFAAYYFALAVSNGNAGSLPDPGMPEVAVLGGSTLLHLANQTARLWQRLRDSDGAAL